MNADFNWELLRSWAVAVHREYKRSGGLRFNTRQLDEFTSWALSEDGRDVIRAVGDQTKTSADQERILAVLAEVKALVAKEDA